MAEAIPLLQEVNLSRQDLNGAKLCGLCLRIAFLGGSSLVEADLCGADLRGADLQACRLFRACLRGSDLREANLRSADVEGADLTDADLRGANLLGVRISRATLTVTDPDDIGTSMQRVTKLPLADDVKQALLEVLQKLDISDSLSHSRKRQVALHLDELIKEMLQCPSDPEQMAKLLAMITEVAPPLAAEVSETVSLASPLTVPTD
jgi:hypothetical protein